MPTLIRNRQLATDSWQQPEPGGAIPPTGDVLVPLARWQSEREAFLAREGRVGVLLEPADEPGVLAADLGRLALVAVNFPKFTDGRGYSVGRMLRERNKFNGELRAVGWVLRDNLRYMERCGFDAFELKPGKPLESAVEAFT